MKTIFSPIPYQELGKTPTAAAATTVQEPRKTLEEVQRMIPDILAETDPIQQAQLWQKLRDSQSLKYFGSANLRTFPVSLSMLEQRTALTPTNLGLDDSNVNLDDFKYATIYVLAFSAISGVASLAFLPPNIGATLCYVFAVLPVLFLGIGSTAPGLIADVIAKMRGANNELSSSVSERDRRIRHEAAHFCCGYWCGLSVNQYALDPMPQVEFQVGTPPYSNTQIAALAVTALAGLVAEAKEYSNAMGAREDLLVLENDVFRKSQEFLGAAAQQDLTRWGALTAALLLQQHKPKFEKVVEAFARNAKLEECITILEST